MIRFQFMEVIMRLSFKKYKKVEGLTTILQKFITTNVLPVYRIEKAQEWRERRYWNEYVDNLYKFHERLLQEIYQTYSGSFQKPGEDIYMHWSEFDRLLTDAELVKGKFTNGVFVSYKA